MKELADYYRRPVSWYSKGGFDDKHGKHHQSGYKFKIDYWEVLNEVDFEHRMTPETYTAVYDAIVQGIREVAPQMKFVGSAWLGRAPRPSCSSTFWIPRTTS